MQFAVKHWTSVWILASHDACNLVTNWRRTCMMVVYNIGWPKRLKGANECWVGQPSCNQTANRASRKKTEKEEHQPKSTYSSVHVCSNPVQTGSLQQFTAEVPLARTQLKFDKQSIVCVLLSNLVKSHTDKTNLDPNQFGEFELGLFRFSASMIRRNLWDGKHTSCWKCVSRAQVSTVSCVRRTRV